MLSTDDLQIDTPEQITLELPLAGIGSRFLGLAVDTILQTALLIAGIFAIGYVDRHFPLDSLFKWIPASFAPAVFILFLFCVYWGYFAFFEVIWKGQTPGKRLTKIRVIHESGRPANVFEVIGRNLLRAIDWMPFTYGAGVVCMMLNAQHKRVGDYVAGTVVVHDRRTEDVRPDWNSAPKDAAGSTHELANITSEELVLIETYLHRRAHLDPIVRDSTAYQISERITTKTGLQRGPEESRDQFLERVVTRVRDTARFR